MSYIDVMDPLTGFMPATAEQALGRELALRLPSTRGTTSSSR